MLSIVQSPNKVLSQKAKPVTSIDKRIRDLLREMEETLLSAQDPEGVGLAAPQVGKAVQIFIVKQSPKSPLLTFINPKIESRMQAPHEVHGGKTKTKNKKGVQLEGCLSIQDIWGVVKRAHGVILSYQDETGEQHKKTFDGFLATIIQHECDHLEGILFPKRVFEQHNHLYRSRKNAEGETAFEEITL
ncbi:MAG: peptide deformylase [Patescibacteria group bacterium]